MYVKLQDYPIQSVMCGSVTHLVVRADVEDADMLGEGLPLTEGRGHGAARLADQERLQQEDGD